MKAFARARGGVLSTLVFTGAILLIASTSPAQRLFATDYERGNVYAFAPDGTESTFASNLVHPTALVFNRAGDLFVAVAEYDDGAIYKFARDGVRSVFAADLSNPQGLAVDNAGNLYESEWTRGVIHKFTPDGIRSTFASGLIAPSALAFNRAGDLFVAEQNGLMLGGDKITRIAPDGTQSIFGYGLLYGLAFDSTDHLFAASFTSGQIFGFTSDGVRGTFVSGMEFPWGLAFNSADELFVADLARWQIYKFTPTGVQSTFASGNRYGYYGLAFEPVPEVPQVPCPCEGPAPGVPWKNHGEYMACVVKAANAAFSDGRITHKERVAIIREAAQSGCGKK